MIRTNRDIEEVYREPINIVGNLRRQGSGLSGVDSRLSWASHAEWLIDLAKRWKSNTKRPKG